MANLHRPVPDRQFSDPELAALYDPFCGRTGRADFDFYLPLIMASGSVLDVGCGTGALLQLARAAGHRGRLVGLDPAAAMLDVARERSDIEWVEGVLESVGWEREFDLVVMTGHAFQVFVTDDEVLRALVKIHAVLTDDGRFAFETRNPGAREWERWTRANALEAATEADVVRLEHDVVEPVEGDVVRFTSTYTRPTWDRPKVSESTLRFLDVGTLSRFLDEARLVVDEQFGDWDRSPVAPTSPEIITIARRSTDGGPPPRDASVPRFGPD